ncbi:MAG: DUF262 domain-containing HNH endonuclease family protein [Helicobacteraceae bacterium]|nr:DUF262 domain-containing HNH endonuclease family protein [Helicobacteraceae bacterium]
MASEILENVFSPSSVFSIPNYQRDYAWRAKNLEDLWEDLVEAAENDSDKMGHFLGTIVVAPNKENPQILDLIDGQQRSTTIFMLRIALYVKASKYERNINKFLDDDDNLRLRVINKNKEFFAKIVETLKDLKLNSALETEAKTQGQKRLYEVAKSILDKLNSIDTNTAEKYRQTLDKMILMKLVESNSGKAIRMFQSVNDRGVPLSLLDKLKSLLILYSNKFCDGGLDDVINERFGEIFAVVVKMQEHKVAPSVNNGKFIEFAENSIFNYHAYGYENIGHYSYGANEAYQTLKEKLKNLQKENLKEWLDNYSSDLASFYKGFYAVMQMSETSVEAFKFFMILKASPFFYNTLIRSYINGFLDEEVFKLFNQAEVLFFGFGSDNRVGVYNLFKHVATKDDFKAGLVRALKGKRVGKGGYNNGYSSFENALNDICTDNFEWGKYFHYAFLTYRAKDMDINELWKLVKDKTFNNQIEHIIPQNAINNGLLERYGFNDEEDFNSLKNTFGNLLSLETPLNSEASDKDLIAKKDEYKKSSISYNREFANSPTFLNFNKETIKQENQNFKKWALEYFKEFL